MPTGIYDLNRAAGSVSLVLETVVPGLDPAGARN